MQIYIDKCYKVLELHYIRWDTLVALKYGSVWVGSPLFCKVPYAGMVTCIHHPAE